MNTFLRIFILNVLIFKSFPIDNLEKEHVTFYAKKEADSNERIARKGVLVKRENAPATVLILHGYTKDKFDVSPFRLFLNNFNCFTFDFRAHGEFIEDQCSTLGHDEVFDIFAAVEYLKSRRDIGQKPIFIFGFSMGAATAIEAQSRNPDLCQGMFLDAPFTSSVDVFNLLLSKLKINLWGYEFDVPGTGLLEKYAFNPYVQSFIKYLLKKIGHLKSPDIETIIKPINPLESIRKVTVPTFFVICKNDEKITPEAVKKIYNNHNGFKRLWITQGRDHCDSIFYDPEEYLEKINKFFNDILNNSLPEKKSEIIVEGQGEPQKVTIKV